MQMKSPRGALVLLLVVVVGVVLFGYIRARQAPTDARVHSVTLHWMASPGATSYNIYRSTASGGRYTKIGQSWTPTYVDTPVPSGAVFYYVVTSVRAGIESTYSQEIKASVP
jgi:fibronectin type 3 domain-containing protein